MLTEFHDIQDLTGAPQTVLFVLEQLAQPLPSSAAHGQHSPSVASVARTYDDATIERPHHATEKNSSELDNHVDFVNWSSSSFAQLTNIDDQCGPRHTRPLWNMFFRHMGHASYNESVIRNEVYVALPKGSSTLEETAMMLISCLPTEFHHVSPSNDSSTSSEYYSAASSLAVTSQGFISDNNSPSPPMISPPDVSETQSTSDYEHAQGELVIPANADTDVEGADTSLQEDETGSDAEGKTDGEREIQGGVSSVSEEMVESTDSPAWNWLRMPDPWDSGQLLSSPPHPPPVSESISSQLPLDAHVLAGAGPQTRLMLPVVCVADPGSIIPLLSSIGYQRRVWNIDIPVVGVEIAEYDSIARLYLAWIDSDSENKDHIHVATSGKGTDTADGIFDMANPDSAMLFAQFLISLRYQFTSLLAAVSSQEPRSLNWRYDSGSPIFSGWYARTLAWVNTIDCEDETNISESISENTQLHSADAVMPPRKNNKKSDASKTKPEPPPPSESNRSTTSAESSAFENTQPRSADAVMPSRNNKKSDGLKTSPDTLSPSESNRSAASAKSKSSGVGSSHMSCSVFANEAAGGLDDGATITTWMCQRSAIQVAFVRLPVNSASREVTFVNDMLDQYDAMTDIVWPASWTARNKLPLVDSEFRNELWDSYEELCRTSGSPPALPDELVFILSANCPAMPAVVGGAYNKDSHDVTSNEAEERHDWDRPLYDFLVAEGQCVSPHVLVERELVFPSNPVLRSLSKDRSYNAHEVQDVLEDWTVQCHSVRTETSKQTSLKKFAEHARNAVIISNALAGSFEALRQSRQFLSTARKQAGKEPRKGKCDAIFFLPIEDAGSNSFKFLKCSKRPQPKQHSDVGMDEGGPSRERDNLPLISLLNSSLYMNPLDGARKDTPVRPRRVLPAQRLSTALLLPCLIAEYKKSSHKSIMEALNQARMYCVSAVHFLAAIGIREWPVYGLVTNGPEGVVIMASMSQYGAVHVFERNPISFNLCKALDVFRFATFLLRLKAKSEALRARFEEVRVDFERRLKAGELDDWGMEQGREESTAKATEEKVAEPAASAGQQPSLPAIQEEDEHIQQLNTLTANVALRE
ncbi:hypothetical protein BDW22DRAFT_1428019 [Trametopsis cervina]|nr:hypothetical protein BDW22DRAFT_1428019 [Trametopsis cervina]